MTKLHSQNKTLPVQTYVGCDCGFTGPLFTSGKSLQCPNCGKDPTAQEKVVWEDVNILFWPISLLFWLGRWTSRLMFGKGRKKRRLTEYR